MNKLEEIDHLVKLILEAVKPDYTHEDQQLTHETHRVATETQKVKDAQHRIPPTQPKP